MILQLFGEGIEENASYSDEGSEDDESIADMNEVNIEGVDSLQLENQVNLSYISTSQTLLFAT